MSGCPAIDASNSGAETMVAAVDCFVAQTVQNGYAALLGQGSLFNQALTIMLTLYVAIIGYRLIFGHSSLGLRDIAPRMLLIGGVLALATNWSAYQVLVYDVLTDGPNDIVAALGGSDGGTQTLLARVDTVTNQMIDIADAWAESNKEAAVSAAPAPGANVSPTVLLPKASLGPNLLLLSAMLLMLTSAGILVVAKALLGLLLALGPLFVALALFRFTRGLAMGWLRVAVLLAIVPLLTLMTCYGALSILEPLVIDIAVAARNNSFELKSAATLLVTTLVVAAIGLQLFRVATALTASWSASFDSHGRETHQPSATDAIAMANPAARTGTSERVEQLVNSVERAQMAAASSSNISLRRDVAPAMMQQAQQSARSTAAAPRRAALAGQGPQTRGALRPVRGAV